MLATKITYIIRVPLAGGEQWHDLCQCESAEQATAVVSALLHAAPGGPPIIKVEVRYLD